MTGHRAVSERGGLAALAIVIGLLGAGGILVSAGEAVPVGAHPPVLHTVQPGETLWGIASRHSPGEDPRRIIHEIVRLNELGSAGIVPGQSISLPPR